MNNDKTLPEELQKEINDKSIAYVLPLAKTTLEGIYLAQIYKDGATEYAQKYEQVMAILKFNHSVLYNEIKSFLDGSK